VLRRRFSNQRLSGRPFRGAAEAVAWFGAVQAQDFAGATWALGQRCAGLTDVDVERAFAAGEIVRTHVMRETWHFMAAADARWLLALTAPRLRAASVYYHRKLEITPAVVRRSQAVFRRRLEGGRAATRDELAAALRRSGIHADGLRLAYLVMDSELDAVICSGPRLGKQVTYALFDERVPKTKPLAREAALRELAVRYLTSHGPATLRDFAWWSGQTQKEIRVGIEAAGRRLESITEGGRTYWLAPGAGAAPPIAPTARLLPNYDEYLIAYKDRELVLARGGDVFAHQLVVDGRLAGSWTRTLSRNGVEVAVAPYAKLSRPHARALDAEVARLGRFLGSKATLATR